MRPRGRNCAALLCVLSAVALNAGCKSDTRTASCTADRSSLQQLLEADKENDKALHDADTAASKGKGPEAVAILESRARPGAERLVERSRAFSPASEWGRERHKEVGAFLQDRSTSVGQYLEALRSDDLRRVVEQMEAQRKLEQRAVEIDRKLSEPIAATACAPLR